MKKALYAATLLLFLGAVVSGAAETADYIEFHKIIDSKCSRCHSRARVDQAISDKRDMLEIEARMIRHGAELNEHEQQVMGIFFRGQKVEAAPVKTGAEDPLAEYRSVVKARCSGCHSLEIVEEAMRKNRKFDGLAQMMLKRGAVLNDQDMKVIQTFWGEPLK